MHDTEPGPSIMSCLPSHPEGGSPPWDKTVCPQMAAEVYRGSDHIGTHRTGDGHIPPPDSCFCKFIRNALLLVPSVAFHV